MGVQGSKENNKNVGTIIKPAGIRWVLLLGMIALGIIVVLVFFENKKETEKTADVFDIKTTYATLKFPALYADSLKYVEVADNGITTVQFFMIYGDAKAELFRICFGHTQGGTLEGYLHTDSGLIPVSVDVSNAGAETITDEETLTKYYAMMEALNTVLDSLRNDGRFRAKGIESSKNVKTQLKYWTVTLPESVAWEESQENGTYSVVFYGICGGERVDLYTIYVGNANAGSVIGTYQVDSKQQMVSVVIGEDVENEDWPEDVQSEIFVLMDSINTVMEAITGDERFEELEVGE